MTKKLEIGNVPAGEIADEYGTPVYVYDREKIREKYDRLDSAFSSRYENFSISYAVKANNNPEVVETLVEKGSGLDTASIAELKIAEELDVDPEDVIYTAPYNKEHELDYAVKQGVTVNLDAVFLLDKLDQPPERLSFRIDPGIGKGDHGLVFGGGDTMFGVPEERAVEAYRKVKGLGVERFGIHMMTGSNVRDPEYFGEITEKLLRIAGEIAEEVGIEFEFVDIGGGLGIPYKPDEEQLDLEKAAEHTVEAFRKGVEEHGIGDPELKVEPGRFLVAESGVLLTNVTGVKKKGEKQFVGIDTGMHHMMRPMLLDAYHEITVANDLDREVEGEKTVVGPVCSNKDVMAEERPLPELHEGDLLGIMSAGAYGFVMASNWNSRPLPAEVMVEEGETELIREPQRPEDIFHGTKLDNGVN